MFKDVPGTLVKQLIYSFITLIASQLEDHVGLETKPMKKIQGKEPIPLKMQAREIR